MGPVVGGAIAGAAGTAALNGVTYLDMLLRGRPHSHVPAEVAGALTRMAHVPIERGAKGVNRLEGIGALLGYAVGIGIGALGGAIRGRFGRAPLVATGVALGAAAMLASDVPATVTKVTNPRSWGISGWLADIIPHMAYGMVAATAFDALMPPRRLEASGLQARRLLRRARRALRR